jgi:15-cis-phytoene synthase
MTIQIPQQTWEATLLAWAQHALDSHTPAEMHHRADRASLELAYQHCDQITAANSRTFYLASGLLPYAKRRAARALYAFCRITDNLVDHAGADAQAGDIRVRLAAWRRVSLEAHPTPGESSMALVALAWADARARYNIPVGYAEQLIDGVARDLTKKRYNTFDELAAYSYGVASTVGLMAMHIIGFAGEEALPYAVKLGVALQMTNILRDVAEDWRVGRVYLPADELASFGLADDDLNAGSLDIRWRAFMKFQIDRNRRLYEEAIPGIALLNAEGRFAIGAAAELYRAILQDIEQHDYDVFTRRSHVPTLGKVSRLPGIWWRSRQTKLH